ncbi:hypothetical protein [Mucilaginibacter myungsuensis]|uniref:Uncharacterized protein n=1 Tax=Mucilaginibacter myungsuensis TaxID=649104 RepID=A0A929KWL3_9SPHI|nr:hypothetical protein [Mucilaginibacter myungsuensis]MBE9661795.1 hypothetical protein [Mucilaginibacter myungsuensis]MDN3599771.1 hypothetical protein [Mucilaginibacter myungsuensis]
MNQTAKILLGCVAFTLVVVKIFGVVHRNAGQLVPTIVVPDSSWFVRDTVWTPAYKQQVTNVLSEQADTLLALPEQRREFTGCIVNRFTRLFPKGLKAISNDSLQLLAKRAYGSCMTSLSDTAIRIWTPYQQKALRQQLYARIGSSTLPEPAKAGYCDCIVEALKNRYSNGIKGKMDTRVVKSTGDSCAIKVMTR